MIIAIALILKLSADHSVVENLVDKAEVKIDSALGFNANHTSKTHHHGPTVQASNMDAATE